MLKLRLILVLLLLICFSIATGFQPRQAAREAAQGQSGSILALLLGDGRKMVANEFFAKADAYFHRGIYPSIFDSRSHPEENHMSEATGHDEHGRGEEAHDAVEESAARPRDWIEGFGRHFYPTAHVHLEAGAEKEMLPWLRLSVALDPHQVQTYVVTAFWLGRKLGKVKEAEQFLREGLSANPNNPELLYQLGSLYSLNREDFEKARHVLEAALRRWRQVEEPKELPNKLLLEQILGGLATIEIQQGRYKEAVSCLEQLKAASLVPDEIQKRIDDVQARLPRQ